MIHAVSIFTIILAAGLLSLALMGGDLAWTLAVFNGMLAVAVPSYLFGVRKVRKMMEAGDVELRLSRRRKPLLAILFAAFVVANLITPADPISSLIVWLAILLVAVPAFRAGLRNGRMPVNSAVSGSH